MTIITTDKHVTRSYIQLTDIETGPIATIKRCIYTADTYSIIRKAILDYVGNDFTVEEIESLALDGVLNYLNKDWEVLFSLKIGEHNLQLSSTLFYTVKDL